MVAIAEISTAERKGKKLCARGNPGLERLGYRYGAETENYYVRDRYYSPSLGRWTEQDPAQYINGANTYQFVNSSPEANVDAGGEARGRFPDTSEPDSVIERIGPDGKVSARAIYNENGQRFLRQDYVGKGHGGVPTPHEQGTTFNEQGQPNGEYCQRLDPGTVDRKPGSNARALPKPANDDGLAKDIEGGAEDIAKGAEEPGEDALNALFLVIPVVKVEARIMTSRRA
jgi:RHS repeat-associated protein